MCYDTLVVVWQQCITGLWKTQENGRKCSEAVECGESEYYRLSHFEIIKPKIVRNANQPNG